MIYRCKNCGSKHDTGEEPPCKPKEEEKKPALDKLIEETEDVTIHLGERSQSLVKENVRRAYDLGALHATEAIRVGVNRATKEKIASIAQQRNGDELFNFIEDCDG